MEIPIINFDIIFLSYDEDNADNNWQDLKRKWNRSKRVHGVYGSDAAHKAAAEESKTERFITCDADTIIHTEFFNTTIPSEIADNMKKSLSWSSRNAVNGLVYGNGSLKCWTKPFVMNMKTHENSDRPTNRVEFCFERGYLQQNEIYSTTYPNGSPRQAWRSGFREGVKMTLDQGLKVPLKGFKDNIYWKNLNRLLIWCSVGSDSENGLWSIYGARMGCLLTMLEEWDYINVRDFEYLNEMWREEISPKFEEPISSYMCTNTGYCWDNDKLLKEIKHIGTRLRDELELNIAEIDENGSRFFKSLYENPNRVERRVLK